MKLGLGLYRQMLTPEYLRFALQVGATHIVAHLPGQFSGSKKAVLTADQANIGFGLSDGDDPIWTDAGISELVALVRDAGLTLEALENFAPAHWYDVLLDGPQRDQHMEQLKQIVRAAGRAGIPTIGYYFSIAGVWGRTEGPCARGGARSVGFADPPQTPIPAGMVWNMVYDYERFTNDSTALAPVSPAQIWDRYRRFLHELLPVAEEAGVTLALHPDDPPLPELRGAARLVYTPDGYQQVLDLSPSPRHAMEFCVGTLSEMPDADIYAMVERYSRTGRIAYVHLRNVDGKAPHYQESFIDDGDTDIIRVLRILHANGFNGVIIPDHVPQLNCPAPWHAGVAHALGYMRAALQALGIREA